MATRMRLFLSPPMLVALLALTVSLAGVSYAAVTLPKNSVGAKQLQKNAVSSKKVKDGSLVAADFGAGQLPAGAQGPKGEPGVPGAKGDQGDQGIQGSSASAILTGVASLTGGTALMPPSGQVTTGAHDDIAMLSPNVSTVMRNFAITVTSAPPAGSTRIWRLFVNGVSTTLCSIPEATTSCTSSAVINIPPGATLALSCLVTGVSAGAATARWGMTIGTS